MTSKFEPKGPFVLIPGAMLALPGQSCAEPVKIGETGGEGRAGEQRNALRRNDAAIDRGIGKTVLKAEEETNDPGNDEFAVVEPEGGDKVQNVALVVSEGEFAELEEVAPAGMRKRIGKPAREAFGFRAEEKFEAHGPAGSGI